MVHEIADGVHMVGVQDPERELFDELIPLPDGTSYNAYLLKGTEKTALIDAVDPPFQKELIENIARAGAESIDYVIANHAEQDHSGAIVDVLSAYPGAKVVTNAKCKEFLSDHLHISEDRFIIVGEGDTISLGDMTLRFILAPWVHWPETMLTYLPERKILFSCDLFGSHLATEETEYKDKAKLLTDAKRYYAEIMMPFRGLIKGHMEKVGALDIDIICASHGPVHYDPSPIMDSYREWISDDVKNTVVIPYVSMHGSTKAMVDKLEKELSDRGIKVKRFNLPKADLGDLAMSLVDAATIVLATPTVLVGPHPAAVYAAYLTNALRPKTRFVGLIGSYGWGGTTKQFILDHLKALNAEVLEPVLVKGLPREEDLEALTALADDIKDRHEKGGIA